MVIDGNTIAREIIADVKMRVLRIGKPVVLAVIVVGDNPVIERFVALKEKRANEAGIVVHRTDFGDDVTTEMLSKKLEELAKDVSIHGIVVQLPLPKHINTQRVLDTIPVEKDVDVLSKKSIEAFAGGTLPIEPPVVGAMQEILDRGGVTVSGKHALVIGRGALVGAPVALWLIKKGARVSIADRTVGDLAAPARRADIVVSGAGVPGLIKQDMLKDGAVLLDAGTSEDGGAIVGDADPSCASKCSLVTPVPGGIGPITIAVLLQNTAVLARGTIK